MTDGTSEKNTGHAQESASGQIPADRPGTEDAGAGNVVDTGFVHEQIKQHPLSRKKLVRRTAVTACMAVLFGAIACAVFLLLEPFISNLVSPGAQAKKVSFPEQTQNEEMSPEDMIADDSEFASSVASEAAEAAASAVAAQQAANSVDASGVETLVRKLLSERATESQAYTGMYSMLRGIAQEAEPSLAEVRGITSDRDWFNEPYETTGHTSGVILADNGTMQLILCLRDEVADAEAIRVTLCDGSQYQAQLIAEDSLTGMAVVGIENDSIPAQTREAVKPCTLGSSAASDLSGTPVIAVGAANGQSGSVSFGTITGNGAAPDITDMKLRLFTTDIYGSTAASGVLIDLGGKVIGITDLRYNSSEMCNVLCAVGITELKPLLEKLSNGESRGYLGIHGSDVTKTAHEEQGIPFGAYVRSAEMDSPAMEAGIRSGDIITGLGEKEISSFGDLSAALLTVRPGTQMQIRLLRADQSGNYEEAQVSAEIREAPRKSAK